MKNAHLIWKNNGEYRATTLGIEAYEQAFNEELPEQEDLITRNLLTGGSYRSETEK